MTQQERERRDAIIAAMLLLMGDTATHLRALVATLAEAGANGLDTFAREFLRDLTAAHATASHLGRKLAGQLTPQNRSDEQFAASIAATQTPFLAAFVNRIANGDSRYVTEDGELNAQAVGDRAVLYVPRLRATGLEAWTLAMPLEVTYDWVLGKTEHCPDCPQIAALSPYTMATLPTYPGAGDTKCLYNCDCTLVASNGMEGFPFVDV